ncbi:hypothetical protein EYF80_036790 [Liparis tanakae]|uniref:Uncharacterized protein n=1 Tax=Liparis tanakae TaxID=230148 RepID=A0A4Z2GIF7_9TELE|nr:hypothetical protein EYF80_036790 [Liparis tanakae]
MGKEEPSSDEDSAGKQMGWLCSIPQGAESSSSSQFPQSSSSQFPQSSSSRFSQSSSSQFPQSSSSRFSKSSSSRFSQSSSSQFPQSSSSRFFKNKVSAAWLHVIATLLEAQAVELGPSGRRRTRTRLDSLVWQEADTADYYHIISVSYSLPQESEVSNNCVTPLRIISVTADLSFPSMWTLSYLV